jgi:predicted DNA-binding transcriptional regulator AlpA
MQISNPYLEIFERLDNLSSAVNKLLSIHEKRVLANQHVEPISEFLFIEDVEKLLKMPISTIRHHIEKHKLPCYKATKPLRFKRSEVIKWFEEYSHSPDRFKNKPTSILKQR